MLAVAIQTNGQIIVGGGGCSGRFVLVWFNADGSLDTAHFGSGGIEVGADINAAFSMTMTATGETVLIGRSPTDSDSIILQDFNTLAATQILYVECDTEYNVTSLTDTSGNVLERYEYDPYGNVTVLNADGSVRGDGTAASSFYESDYLYQGMRYSVSTGTYASDTRIYRPSLGRWLTEDPARYIDGSNTYQGMESDPVALADPSGLDVGATTQPNEKNGAQDVITGENLDLILVAKDSHLSKIVDDFAKKKKIPVETCSSSEDAATIVKKYYKDKKLNVLFLIHGNSQDGPLFTAQDGPNTPFFPDWQSKLNSPARVV